jgi:PKD repeat protein
MICLVLFLGSVANALTYPPGFQVMQVPDPLAGDNPSYPLFPLPEPAVGDSFFDARFGTILTRTVQGSPIRHEYARFDPFNADKSMVILHNCQGDYRVYKTSPLPVDQSDNLVTAETVHLEELRWDPTDPNLIWALDGENFSIVKFNPVTGVRTVEKDFRNDLVVGPLITSLPDLWRITTRDEGEASIDMRWWGLMIQGGVQYDYNNVVIFTYDRLSDKVLGTYKFSPAQGDAVNWAGMSPLGSWVVMGGDVINGLGGGITIADKEFKQLYLIGKVIGHCDVGLDTQGKEVLIGQNSRTDYIDIIPLDPSTKPVDNLDDYVTSGAIRLARLFYASESPVGFRSGVHISGNYPGYAVISTYTASDVQEQNWLDRTVTLARLDRANPQLFYLAKVYNTTGQHGDSRTYWEETHATITRDGSRVVWSENWGQYGPDVEHPRAYLMQLDMPTIPVTPAPVANFTANPTSGPAPLTVQFNDASTGSITSRSWDLGDGDTSMAQVLSHTYTTPGTYTVILSVTGPGGSSSKTATIEVFKKGPLKASFTATPTHGSEPLIVQFTDTSIGWITSWAWNFGDGGSSTEPSPSHTYHNPGKYKAKLTVSGPGGSRSKSATIKVTP